MVHRDASSGFCLPLYLPHGTWTPMCRTGTESNEHKLYSMLSFNSSGLILVHGPSLLQMIWRWLALIIPILRYWGKIARPGMILLLMLTVESHEEHLVIFCPIKWIPLFYIAFDLLLSKNCHYRKLPNHNVFMDNSQIFTFLMTYLDSVLPWVNK